ncbi:hypothetical protein HPB128_6g1 [Helicobacter pylori B128]|nr:hypothetical protein HPB128_6g1 [Helicobacter pylori B128]
MFLNALKICLCFPRSLKFV